MSLALYRKYRPKKLEDLLGQETNVEILKNAAKTGRFGHAYLFYGSRGTGKTTTARLIAKLLNCEKRQKDEKFRAKGEPCNDCRHCREIDQNISMDVLEIDAASNRGIDEIRNIKENIKTAPASGEYKVYIIDEAHMLTGAAFNALLKTLEEPPAHGVIVLATTEYDKLPATITSRTQRFLFKKLPKGKIAEKLTGIAKTEKIKISPDALELVAAAGDGSLRDAESLLDQISSLGEKIDLADAERLIGRIGFQKVHVLAEYILKDDLQNSVAHIFTLQNDGYNLIQLTKDLIEYLRKILTLKINPSLEKVFLDEMTKEEMAKMKHLLELAAAEKQIQIIKALIRAWSEMRYSPLASVPLEIALTEILEKNEAVKASSRSG